jgi:hypothetical protein
MVAEFKGKSLIEIPKDIPNYNVLKGDFGKGIVDEYNSVVKSKYKDNSNLKVLNFRDNVAKGSNDYAIFLMDDIVAKYGLRAVNPADVQKIIDINGNFLKEFYVDLGVILRNDVDLGVILRHENVANEYLARQLANQAKDKYYNFSNLNPLVFKPSDLELIVDNNSPSGLGFKIKDLANPFNAPALSYINFYRKFNKTNEDGVPIFDKNGNRTSYTEKNGLSGFGLGGVLSLSSRDDNLAYSNDVCRVVLINDGGKLW